jgi:hypothetical protein
MNNKKQTSNIQHFRVKKDPKIMILRFDDKTYTDLQNMANELNIPPGEIINKAFYLFKLAQGRTIILKEKNKSTNLKIKDFEKNDQRV